MRTWLAVALTAVMMACGAGGDGGDADDTDLVDTETVDTDVLDTVVVDTDVEDTVVVDTDVEDTVVVDTEVADTVVADTDVSAGACDNTADLAALAAAQATIGDDTQTCTFGCVGSGRLASCVATCVANEVGLTSGCATCFGRMSACIVAQCAVPCLDATSSACTTCRQTKCEPAFETCSGVSPP